MVDPKDFRIWQAMVGKNGMQVAIALGKSTDTISRYRKHGVPMSEETMVRLAMAAVAAQLPPWSAPK
jgi:TPP-dependent pyruvate/acetoin dehydrogenase alpha subunit